MLHELGALDAERFCTRLELDPAECEMVAWLVKHHLLMSQTAQRKDLSDPVNIQDFAQTVGNTRYLDHLYLLTVADIAGTSPKLWNSWNVPFRQRWITYRSCCCKSICKPVWIPLKREPEKSRP